MERKANRRLKISEKQWICLTKRNHPGFSNARIAQNVQEEFGITVTNCCIRQTLSKESEIMAAEVEEPSQQSKLQTEIRNKFEAKLADEVNNLYLITNVSYSVVRAAGRRIQF